MDREERIKVYIETKRIASALYGLVPRSRKYHDFTEIISRKTYERTYIDVTQEDTINCAISLLRSTLNPAVLNFSDWDTPGGLVEQGYGTQEENLFRRSNYFLTLTSKHYPMRGHEVVYSPDVTVFRSDEQSNYIEKDPLQLSFIACPAIAGPKSNGARLLERDEIRLITRKIRMIFNVALFHGHDSLVLGAWGCGAFANPPEHISEIFRDVCDEYHGYFREIVFAIYGGNVGNCRPSHNEEIFRKTFDEKMY